jgi:hypothetical protein
VTRVLLPQNFNTVGWAILSGQIWNKPFTNAPPAWFFATPLQTATGPRQLLSIEQSTARPNYSVGKMTTEAIKHLSMLKGMLRRLQPNSWNGG